RGRNHGHEEADQRLVGGGPGKKRGPDIPRWIFYIHGKNTACDENPVLGSNRILPVDKEARDRNLPLDEEESRHRRNRQATFQDALQGNRHLQGTC
ncbi:MAG: hypothetical protein FD137_775, partial [Spirochaetes bacterium]